MTRHLRLPGAGTRQRQRESVGSLGLGLRPSAQHSRIHDRRKGRHGYNFMLHFPANILGATSSPQTLVQGWVSSIFTNQVGMLAAMGPIMNVRLPFGIFGISDYGDYYRGKGSVGPSISAAETHGWWFIQGTDAVQEFP